MCYLHPCEAGTQIRGNQPFKLEFKLYFAYRESQTWGDGGVAFVETTKKQVTTLARAYLLTLEQFICIAVGENAGKRDFTIMSSDLYGSEGKTREIRGGTTKYRVLLHCGRMPADGRPVVTLTGAPEQTRPKTLPSKPYLATIWKGLRETYKELSDLDIGEYIRSALHETRPDLPDLDIREYIRSFLYCFLK
jgi:hypothetical protein